MNREENLIKKIIEDSKLQKISKWFDFIIFQI